MSNNIREAINGVVNSTIAKATGGGGKAISLRSNTDLGNRGIPQNVVISKDSSGNMNDATTGKRYWVAGVDGFDDESVIF